MLRRQLQIAVALAFIAGAFAFGPVTAQAQSAPDDDSAYANSGSVERPDAGDDDTLDNGDDDLAPPPIPDDDRADGPRGDDEQAFARTEEETRCIAEFRSFDPATGTYETDDGERLRCPYLY